MLPAWLWLVALGAAAAAGDPEVFRVMPPGERVLQSDTSGISAQVIVESSGPDQPGRLHSDLRGALRLELGGVVLELREGRARSVDPTNGRAAELDARLTRRLELHDFFGYALETRVVFAETSVLDDEGRRWAGQNPGGESGVLYRDERGRVSGYDVVDDEGPVLEVRFLDWTRIGDLEVPRRVRTSDPREDRIYRLGGFREEAMPETGRAEAPRWVDEAELPAGARDALAAEREFALMSRLSGMKAAFLEWLVPSATVFGPGPMTVEERFAAVPDDPAAQPALEWLPEWIVISAARDLAAISGRWNLRPPEAEHPNVFGQYLSVWRKSPQGWRVVADIGSSQDEERPLTPRATGRVLEARAPRVTMVPDPATLAAQVEGEFAELAYRDGYLPALRDRADPDVIVLRVGSVARRGVDALTAPAEVSALGPRIEIHSSAASASHDLLATWGVLHFDADPTRRFAFLRVWQLETARWQVAADVMQALP